MRLWSGYHNGVGSDANSIDQVSYYRNKLLFLLLISCLSVVLSAILGHAFFYFSYLTTNCYCENGHPKDRCHVVLSDLEDVGNCNTCHVGYVLNGGKCFLDLE